MGFTSNIKVPKGTADKIREQTRRNRRLLADGLRLFVMTGALAGRFDVAAAARYPEALYYTEG